MTGHKWQLLLLFNNYSNKNCGLVSVVLTRRTTLQESKDSLTSLDVTSLTTVFVFRFTRLRKIFGFFGSALDFYKAKKSLTIVEELAFIKKVKCKLERCCFLWKSRESVPANRAGVKRNETCRWQQSLQYCSMQLSVLGSGADIHTFIDSLCAHSKTVITCCYYTLYQKSPWPCVTHSSTKRSERTFIAATLALNGCPIQSRIHYFITDVLAHTCDQNHVKDRLACWNTFYPRPYCSFTLSLTCGCNIM